MTQSRIPYPMSNIDQIGSHSNKFSATLSTFNAHTFRYIFDSLRSRFGPYTRRHQIRYDKGKGALSCKLAVLTVEDIVHGDLWEACTSISSIKGDIIQVPDLTNRQQKLTFMLKKQLTPTQHELRLPLQSSGVPYCGTGGFDGESLQSFISMLPAGCQNISAKANPSGLVARLLPLGIVSKEARYVGSAFWLWLCTIDDLTEELMGEPFKISIDEIKRVFRRKPVNDANCDVVVASCALLHVINTTKLYDDSDSELEQTWKHSFVSAVMEILHAFEAEKPLMTTKASGGTIKMADWMNVRVITISARPFMILGKASLKLSATLSTAGYTLQVRGNSNDKLDEAPGLSSSVSTLDNNLENHDDLTKVEILTQCIMGLQNDILGWEKDHAEDNGLNAVEVYINQGMDTIKAMTEVVAVHNALVDRMMTLSASVTAEYANDEGVQMSPTIKKREWPFGSSDTMSSASSPRDSIGSIEAWAPADNKERLMMPKYVALLGNQIWGMAAWTHSSKRYAA